MIRFDFDKPMVRGDFFSFARKAQHSFVESSDLAGRSIEEQKLLDGLRLAFSGFLMGSSRVGLEVALRTLVRGHDEILVVLTTVASQAIPEIGISLRLGKKGWLAHNPAGSH